MDVERIQKINKLALDLMRQGLAVDRDDAVVQAEKVFRAKDGEYSSIRERMQATEPQREVSAASIALTQNNQQSGAADLHPEKVKDILQQNSQFLVKKITEFQEQIQAMRKELDMMKQLRMSAPQQQNSVSSAPPKLGEIPANNPDIQRGPSTQASASNHPRTGNFKAEEISIEKFFYMGNKR
ncbi:MAG TPA: hypothetical protein VJA18_04595 [Candidatus Nanoarchaeia archaeon]|nr:hypothetical protein [Candidatus Nanoarchaeia archaeon]